MQPVSSVLTRDLLQPVGFTYFYGSQIANLSQKNIILAPLSPFQCCPAKFCTSYCIASNIGKEGEGKKITRDSVVKSFLSLR